MEQQKQHYQQQMIVCQECHVKQSLLLNDKIEHQTIPVPFFNTIKQSHEKNSRNVKWMMRYKVECQTIPGTQYHYYTKIPNEQFLKC